jgi:prepilin-type N-terminal cleavage/methylation domain-containing protein
MMDIRLSGQSSFGAQVACRMATSKGKRSLMKKAGFTLIELMIVVAIIAIIAAIAIPNLMTSKTTANENAALATIRAFGSAAVDKATKSSTQYYWDTPATFSTDFNHVTPKAGFIFTYLSNGTAPSATVDDDNASKFVYVAGPVSTASGKKAYFIDENQTVYEAVNLPTAAVWTAPAVADWAVNGPTRITTPAGVTWNKK